MISQRLLHCRLSGKFFDVNQLFDATEHVVVLGLSFYYVKKLLSG